METSGSGQNEVVVLEVWLHLNNTEVPHRRPSNLGDLMFWYDFISHCTICSIGIEGMIHQ